MPLFLAAALPWIIGAGAVATATSFVIKDQNQRAAEKRANSAFETLQSEQDRFKDRKAKIQGELTSEFGSGEREETLQAVKDEIGARLKSTSSRLRDDSALTDKPTGDVSGRFINQRAGVQEDLDLRLDEKTTNLGNVLARGGANFREGDEVRSRGQELTTENSLQRANLGVHEDKVNAASIVEDSLLADILGVVGPLALSAGVGGLFAPAAAPGLGATLGSSGGVIADLAGTTLASGAAIPALTGAIPQAGLAGIGAGLARVNRFVPPSLGGI